MKPPRQNVGKAGTKGTKPLPDGVGIAVRPFPIHLFNAAFDEPHDLGEILTPEQMAAKATPHAIAKANGEPPDKVPASVSPRDIAKATGKAIAALVGSGPKQDVPHFDTALALAEGLASLRDFAHAGDLDAMHALGFVLSQAVADLGEMARTKPEVVREWSRKQNVVPVLTGKNKGHRTQLATDLDAFDVGALSAYRVNPPKGRKNFDSSASANALASLLCAHLASYRFSVGIMQRPEKWARLALKLPPLSKAVWEKWADAAWACLLDATDSHPEKCPALEPLGAKAARKAGLQTPRTRAANVRAEIRQTLREAIRTLARVSPAPYSE